MPSNIFFEHELSAAWSRYNELKERDRNNYQAVFKLFALLIVYASAPFSLDAFRESGFIRVWGIGGVWLSAVVWFIADRNFRAYGYHVKERLFCLNQLAILRDVLTRGVDEYRDRSLFPLGSLYRNKAGSSFPEKVSPTQMLAASYIFKLITGFPPLYTVLFLGLVLFPKQIVGNSDLDAILLFCRILVGASFVLFAWVWASAHRCMTLQKLAFAARRISSERPWQMFPDKEVGERIWGGRRLFVRTLKFIIFVIVAANIIRAVYLMASEATVVDSWQLIDCWLAAITVCVLTSIFLFTEIDIRNVVSTAKQVDPIERRR